MGTCEESTRAIELLLTIREIRSYPCQLLVFQTILELKAYVEVMLGHLGAFQIRGQSLTNQEEKRASQKVSQTD